MSLYLNTVADLDAGCGCAPLGDGLHHFRPHLQRRVQRETALRLLGDASLPDRPQPVAGPHPDERAGGVSEAVLPGPGQHSPPLRPRAVPQARQEDAGHPAQDGAGGDQEWLRQVLQVQQRRNGVRV